MVSFEELMKHFGVVTVFNACIFVPEKSYTGYMNCKNAGTEVGGLSHEDFQPAYEYIDTLKIANITQEGPTKSITGGQFANTLIKYGKTATIEMQDALGRASTLVRFFGAEYDGYVEYMLTSEDVNAAGNLIVEMPGVKVGDKLLVRKNGTKIDASNYVVSEANKVEIYLGTKAVGDLIQITRDGSVISITDKFPGAFAIEGDTFFVDQKTGEQKHVFVFIPQYVPDAILTLTQDAEGDAAVFDCNGSLNLTTIVEGGKSSKVFYQIRENSFFAAERTTMNIEDATAAKTLGTMSTTVKTATPEIELAGSNVVIMNWDDNNNYKLYNSGTEVEGATVAEGAGQHYFVVSSDGTYTVKATGKTAGSVTYTESDVSNAVEYDAE